MCMQYAVFDTPPSPVMGYTMHPMSLTPGIPIVEGKGEGGLTLFFYSKQQDAATRNATA